MKDFKCKLFVVKGTCKAIPGMEVRTYGGNGAGSACIFPFDFDFNTYTQCVDNNGVSFPE